MNKKISFIPAISIIILCSIAVGTILFLAVYKIYQEITITTLPSLKEISLEEFGEETADWEIYRNERYGFEISYPLRNWIFRELKQNNKSYGFTLCKEDSENSEEKKCIFITPIILSSKCYNLELKEIIEKPSECISKYSWGVKFEKEITADSGVTGIIGKGFDAGYNSIAAFFFLPDVLIENNNRLLISVYYYSSLWDFSEIYPFNEEKEEIFDQIISTFRLID